MIGVPVESLQCFSLLVDSVTRVKLSPCLALSLGLLGVSGAALPPGRSGADSLHYIYFFYPTAYLDELYLTLYHDLCGARRLL